jgi:hypothetical protein
MLRPIIADDGGGGGGSYQHDGNNEAGEGHGTPHDEDGEINREPRNSRIEDNQHEKGFLDRIVEVVKEVEVWFEEKMKEIHGALSGMAMELENGVTNTLTGVTQPISLASQIPQPYIQFAQNGLTILSTGAATFALFGSGAGEVAVTAYAGIRLTSIALTFAAAWTDTAMLLTGNSEAWRQSNASALQMPLGIAVTAGTQTFGYSTSKSLATAAHVNSINIATRALINICSGKDKVTSFIGLTQEYINLYETSHKKKLP